MKIVSSLSQELRLCDCILNVIKCHILTVMIPASQKSILHEFEYTHRFRVVCSLEYRAKAPKGEHLWPISGHYLNVVFCVPKDVLWPF